jgi:glycosyltransferase involved in cell wall biosynthesis
MRLTGLMLCRNEGWIVGLSARVALKWCDELIVLNHASTDNTVELLADLQAEDPCRVHVISVPDTTWTEMQHRQFTLDLARAKGATHCAIVDADEIMTGNLATRILKNSLEWSARPESMLQLPGYNMRGEPDRYHINGTWGQRWFSTAFKDHERLHWSSRDRTGYDHHQREPMGMQFHGYRPIKQGEGGVMHLWGVTERRLFAKHAWYKITEALRWPEKSRKQIDEMYSLAIKGADHDLPKNWQYAKAPDEWWVPYKPLMKYLDLTIAPWQEAEARRLYVKHGPDAFRGLDLFGVV